MRALITLRQTKDTHDADIDTLESNYICFFENLGYDLIPVPNFTNNPTKYLDLGINVVIITGGGSIPGEYYSPSKEGLESPQRDLVEKVLFFAALERKIPVIAICRGMQYVNALLGGKLSVLSNLNEPRKIAFDHKISLYGETLYVNNYHNDGIYLNNLSEQLEPIGIDEENNIVEIYVHKTERILAFQSHPERCMKDKHSKEIIVQLIKNFINNK